MITATIQPEQFIKTDYVSARKLIFSMDSDITIVLAGCGGTGSWLAPSVARISRLLMDKFERHVFVHFIDPDDVEEKNCYRQNFARCEVGRRKAETLAMRYGMVWGLDITAHPMTIKHARSNIQLQNSQPTIIVGCVDRPSAREEIRTFVKDAAGWWLDCGNFKAAGQVVLGSGRSKNAIGDPLKLPGYCAWLPMPDVQHPELTSDQSEERVTLENNLSCADLAMLDSQGMAVNQAIAAIATDYLVRMLLTKDLTKYATYIDLASGSTRSNYITPDAIKKYIEEGIQ